MVFRFVLQNMRVFGNFEQPIFLELVKQIEYMSVPANQYLFKVGLKQISQILCTKLSESTVHPCIFIYYGIEHTLIISSFKYFVGWRP